MVLSALLRRAAPRSTLYEFASEFSQLPPFRAGQPQEARDWGLLAGGLALLLSRCSERGARRDFPASLEAYRCLKRQMQTAVPQVRLPLQILSELRHEIAGVADAATCAAARRCMERRLAGGEARLD